MLIYVVNQSVAFGTTAWCFKSSRLEKNNDIDQRV